MPRYRLGSICQIISGSTPKTGVQEYWNGDKKWITPAELSESDYIIYDTERKLTDVGVKSAGLTPLPEGTVILSSRAPIGKVAIAGCEMYCNQGFKNLVCTDVINNRYLYWYLKSKTDYLNSLGRGATFKEISKSTVSDIELNVPELSTQIERVAHLEKLQSIITGRRTQLAKLDELVKCRFVELFAQGFPIIKLGNVFETCSGGTPSSKNSDYYDGGNIPWLTSGEVNKGIIYQADSFITLAGLENSSAKWIPADSVVVAMYGATAGKVGLVKYRTTTNQAVCSILPHADYHPLFLYYAVQQQENWMLSQVVGGAQQNLSQQIVRRMEIPSPPYSLQIEFANYASRIDKLRFVIQKSLDETQKLFDSLMQEYFD